MNKTDSTTLFREQYDLVTAWVSSRETPSVQVARHREMGRILPLLEALPAGGHAGYEQTFTYHFSQVQAAMLQDPAWLQAINDLEATALTGL